MMIIAYPHFGRCYCYLFPLSAEHETKRADPLVEHEQELRIPLCRLEESAVAAGSIGELGSEASHEALNWKFWLVS